MRRPPPWTDFTKYPVVSLTIALAVGVTLASWSGRLDITSLVANVDVRRGQIWRLLTSALPHGDILHLVFNLYWTWVFGTLIEGTLGSLWTLAIFVLLSIAGNGAEYAILDGGIGLSGIGYGLFGLLWVLSSRDRRFTGAIDRNTVGLFVVWFFLCIILTAAGHRIGNIAHGVGAVTGALVGWSICGPRRQLVAAAAALFMLVSSVLVGATIARPWINLARDRGQDEGYLGYQFLVARNEQEAIRWLRDAAQMNPQEATYWFDLGIAYDDLHRTSEATVAYRRALDLEPYNAKYEAAANGR
jgi:membrane associated rhomboid family serine protease